MIFIKYVKLMPSHANVFSIKINNPIIYYAKTKLIKNLFNAITAIS